MSARVFILILSLFFVTSLVPESALSLDYPMREIEFISAYAPGSNNDTSSRLAAKFGEKYAGKPIVVVNKVGGGGALGYAAVAMAKPDGYTLGLVSPATITKCYLTKGVGYKKDSFQLVAQMSYSPSGLYVKKGGPCDVPLKELIRMAKEKPETIVSAMTGLWGVPHIAQVIFEGLAGIKSRGVPYPEASAAIPAILGGHADFSFEAPSQWAPLYNAGKVNVLAVTAEQRDPRFPNIPTFKELGFDIVMGVTHWIAAPARTPNPIINFLADAFKKACNEQGYKEAVDRFGSTAAWASPEDATKEWNKVDEIFQGLIKKYDLKPQ